MDSYYRDTPITGSDFASSTTAAHEAKYTPASSSTTEYELKSIPGPLHKPASPTKGYGSHSSSGHESYSCPEYESHSCPESPSMQTSSTNGYESHSSSGHESYSCPEYESHSCPESPSMQASPNNGYESHSNPGSPSKHASPTNGYESHSNPGSPSMHASPTNGYEPHSNPELSSTQASSTIGYESSSTAVPVSFITVTAQAACTLSQSTSCSAALATPTPHKLSGTTSSYKFTNSSNIVTPSNTAINLTYFNNPTMNTGYGYPYFEMTSFKKENSIYNGTASQIGFSNSTINSNGTLYPGAPSCSIEHLAIVHTGFVYARKAGNYTFTITAADDVVMGWIGPHAYYSYSARNADVVAANYNISRTIKTCSKILKMGQIIPFKVLWANGANNHGNLGFTIQGPNSTLLSSEYGSAKDVITTAPSGTKAF
ncbi:hypothetical protein DSL72_008920 [Monilinia vaccinii-corymbosi]|uniref:PA14 domain-containing protein n=1 Tax=Monilinia vaccinii-corymbosi TaxID=61207 RepID=A0A8A3PRN6_9HELO|nr:hypothetical protein DSL72_008920 [Monilinia vaccinii-corymbosi]